MAGWILCHGSDPVDIFAVNKKWGMCCVDELVWTGELLEKTDQFLLRGWMKMQSRLIE